MSFDPGTIALIAGGAKAVGALFGGEGNAQASEYNAAIAQQNAGIARQQGQAAADAQHRAAERTFGSMIANYGASGVQSDNGSPVDALVNSAQMATLDNLTTKYNYEVKAIGYENEAQLDKMKAQSARTSAVLGAAGAAAAGYAMYSYMNPASSLSVDTGGMGIGSMGTSYVNTGDYGGAFGPSIR